MLGREMKEDSGIVKSRLDVLDLGVITLFIKGQMVNILGSVSHTVSVAIT